MPAVASFISSGLDLLANAIAILRARRGYRTNAASGPRRYVLMRYEFNSCSRPNLLD